MGETIRLCCVVVAGRGSHSRPVERSSRVALHIALVCFPIIFLAELPDKTMFASLLMATKGRPAQVWLGAAGAFVVHVAIATTVGVALFAVLPRQAIDGVVAALFLFGAVYAWREGRKDEAELVEREGTCLLYTSDAADE